MASDAPQSNDLFKELLAILQGNPVTLNASEPQEEVQTGEQILGPLVSPLAKNLYRFDHKLLVLSEHGRDMIKDLIKKSGYSFDIPNELEQHLAHLHNIKSVVEKLFWLLVSAEYPETDKPGIVAGIRKNWQIVAMKNSGNMTGILVMTDEG